RFYNLDGNKNKQSVLIHQLYGIDVLLKRSICEILSMMGTVPIILRLSMTQGVYESLILIILFACLIRYICSDVPGHGVNLILYPCFYLILFWMWHRLYLFILSDLMDTTISLIQKTKSLK
ncbi:hypothetical protein BDA99DRAFT_541155, partial [Phascolomyces articulosus]